MAADMQKLIGEARELLNNGDIEDALQLLSQYSQNPQYTENCMYLNILGESLLETSQVEEAYNVYSKSIQLDPNGVVSVDPYFTLGQIIGGKEGLQLIQKGLDILTNSNKTVDNLKKITKAIFSQIEIWMTDLCMEPEAESQCESLIREALSLDSANPETYSLLASIQISQQKTEEAKQNLSKSWDLFSDKKQKLEDSADSDTQNKPENDSGQEYIDLIQPLLTLAKFCIEVGLFDLGATISSNIHDISDDLLEPFYLEAFSNYLAAKTLQYDLSHRNQNSDVDNRETRLQNIYEMPLSISEDGQGMSDDITNYIVNAVCALVNGDKVLYSDETADEEVKQQMKVLVDELGGRKAFKRIQALNKSDSSAVTEENWEQHI